MQNTKTNRVIGDRYQLLEVIGQGGMAHVWRAVDLRSSDEVALKVPGPEAMKSRRFSQRFSREIRIAQRLHHPSICPIIDVAPQDVSEPFFAMPLLEGGDLGRLMAAGPVAPDHACSILAQVLSALAYAHQQKVVHRDIKPSNIFLLAGGSEPGTVQLLDFGIGKLFEEDEELLTTTGALLGTAWYMSPEQRRNAKVVDERSDLYTVGILMYELLTGHHPFDNQDKIDQGTAPFQIASPRSLNFFLSSSIESIILKALQVDPLKRYQDAGAFARAIEEIPPRDIHRLKQGLSTDTESCLRNISVSDKTILDGDKGSDHNK